MHEAQVSGDLLGAYLHCTATTPFETVCKQFINGSVPFGYSLNSGFDTGNDSWFSSGAGQVGTPVQKMPAGYRCSVGWERAEEPPPPKRGLGYHFLLGSGSLRKKKNKKQKSPCTRPQKKKKKKKSSRRKAFAVRGPQYSVLQTCSLSHMHTLTHSAKICTGTAERVVFRFPVTPHSRLHKRLPRHRPALFSQNKEDTRCTA